MTIPRLARNAPAALTMLITTGLLFCAGGCGGGDEGGSTAGTDQADAPAEAPGGGGEEGGGEADTVQVGDLVSLHYRGTLSDGSVFDQSQPDRPLSFRAGRGQVIPGFDEAVLGMKVDEEKTVTIPAAEAYGHRNSQMVINVALSNFADDFEAKEGDDINIRNEAGNVLRGVIVDTSPDSLLIDFNHPLAGEELTFDIKVIGIE